MASSKKFRGSGSGFALPTQTGHRLSERLDKIRQRRSAEVTGPVVDATNQSDDGDDLSVFDDFAADLEVISFMNASPELDNHSLQVFDMAALRARYEALETSEKGMKSILKKFDLKGDIGRRALKPIPERFVGEICELKKRYPNCGEFLDFMAHFANLARIRTGGRHMRFPPVLLAGPPGVGKTAVVREVAKLLDVKCRTMDMGATTASFVLSGMSSSWSEAKTGCVVDLLRDGQAANPILVLDELDKTSSTAKHDPLGALYTLLEPDAARTFVDEALDIPCDASQVLYVATANNLERISAPLLSRFVVLHIQSIVGDHHQSVTQSIYRTLLEQHGVAELFSPALSKSVLIELSNFSPRQIKIILMRAIACAASRRSGADRMDIQSGDLIKPPSESEGNPVGFIW